MSSAPDFRFDPLDTESRDALITQHPINRRQGYIVRTPPLTRVINGVAKAVAEGRTGLAYVAHPRFGKSTAALFAQSEVRRLFPSSIVVLHICMERARPNELRLWTELSTSMQLAPPPGKDTSRHLTRIVTHCLATLASAPKTDQRVVLILDEASKMCLEEFAYMCGLINQLESKGVTVTTVLFAQPRELIHARNTFVQSERQDIVARLILRIRRFEGLRSEDELTQVLGFYDDPLGSEFPQGSGCACTRFFLPRAYDAGFRLSEIAPQLWNALTEGTRAGREDEQNIQVGMQWIVRCLQKLLDPQKDAKYMKILKEDIAHAVRLSDWTDLRTLLSVEEDA